MAAKTPYCRLFGPAPATLGLRNTHSGMSPLGPPPLQEFESKDKGALRKRVEEYQKRRMRGFTTQMLVDLDAITNRELKPNDIATVLDPIFRKDRWVQLPSVYIDNLPPNHVLSLTDPWSVQMNSVWNALYPVLCLTSVMLKHIYRHPWFDALIMGNVEPVPNNRLDAATLLTTAIQPGDDLRYIKLRPPGSREDCEAHRLVLFTRNLDPFLELGFMDGFINPNTGKKMDTYICGLTARKGRYTIKIYIAKQEVWPLLRTDLTSSQRSASQLVVLQTLMHEVIHAYNMANDIHHYDLNNSPQYKRIEPYFEDEQINELGYSAENSIFGGLVADFISEPHGKPSLGNFHVSWPDRGSKSKFPVLINPEAWPWRVCSPVPVSYYEMIQSDAFWRVHFRSFGTIRADRSAVASVTNTSTSPIPAWSVQVILPYWPPQNREIQNRIEMNPDERSHYSSKMKTAKLNAIIALLRGRDDAVTKVIDYSELCESLKRSPDTAMYLKELERFYEQILGLVNRTVACIPALKDVEDGGGQRIDLRNNILAFEHNLRRLIRSFEKCGDADLEKRLSKLIIELEASTVGVALKPSAMDVYGSLAALVEEQEQKRLLDGASTKFYRGDIEGCHSDCIAVMTSLGATIPQRSHARLLFAQLAVAPLAQRRAELDRAEQTMRKVLAGGGSHEAGMLTHFENDLAVARKQVDEEEEEEGERG